MNTASPSRGGFSIAGLLCALGGTGLWGVSFVVPLFLPGISPWDISLGRYLIFGIIGVLFTARSIAAGSFFTVRQWGWAFVFAATGCYGAYVAMVYAISLSGPALLALVTGLTPMAVALVGNMRSREIPLRAFLMPLLLSGAGLALTNLARHGQGLSLQNLGLGLAASLTALTLMTFYLVANIFFLKNNPRIKPLPWANAVGAVTLVFALAALMVKLLLHQGLPWAGAQTSAATFWTGTALLGIGSSWIGGALWNRASALLSPAVAGQCVVFWPISGIIYACIIDKKFPAVWETAGILMVFAGVLWGLAALGRRPRPRQGSAP